MHEENIAIKFWGVRGTMPVPGPQTIRYGGNTNCVSVHIGNKLWLVFDAGSGILQFSNYIQSNHLFPISAKILITHPHWDHINGLPYFAPFYTQGNEFEIFSPCEDNMTVKELIFSQMDNVYFPVSAEQIAAKLSYQKVDEQIFHYDDVEVNTMRLSHPGICMGYRIKYNNKVLCYITDNELYLEDSDLFDKNYYNKLVKFIYKCDLLIIDSTYTDTEYLDKISWGHACISQVVKLADKAKVKLLSLYHHDPSQTDDDIDRKLETAKNLLTSMNSTTRCIAPSEGDNLIL